MIINRKYCGLFIWILTVVSHVGAAEPKPNILYIVADDLGWKDVGYHGSDIKTPNIDRLAKTGARLEQFYTQPMCTPTRAALMTGRYPFRYGLQTGVILSGHTYGLPTNERLLPQILKEVGYVTAIIGKWHLGHADHKYWPRQRGFDYQYGPLIGEIDYFTHKADGVVDWYRNNQKVEEEGYSTTLLGNDAVKFVTQHDTSKPLFLYLAFNAAHTPYQAPKNYLDKYKNIADSSRRAYAGSITAMDDQIGRVLEALKKNSMINNTLIIFHSDNGGTHNALFAGAITDMAKVKIPCDNGPYRDGKGTLYEGGTRVCALVNWPGHVKSGIVEGMIHVVDMFPTIAGLSQAAIAKGNLLDGIDVWSTLSEGKPSPRTEIVYNVEPFRGAVRQGDWKLIWRTPLPAVPELYNVALDPSEKNNVATVEQEKVKALQKRINELASTMEKPMFLLTEFTAMNEHMHMPPSFPDEEYQFGSEPEHY